MSAASELREAIFKASNAHDLYDDGVDAILDAVIAELYKLSAVTIRTTSGTIEHLMSQKQVMDLLQSAKETTQEKE